MVSSESNALRSGSNPDEHHNVGRGREGLGDAGTRSAGRQLTKFVTPRNCGLKNGVPTNTSRLGAERKQAAGRRFRVGVHGWGQDWTRGPGLAHGSGE